MLFDPGVPVTSLYIHWPFCPYKCHFCPFVALANHDQFMGQYHAALVKEIQLYGPALTAGPLNTIFFGGGTPSTYPPELLLDMFGILKDTFTFDPRCEITLEVNPGTVTSEKIALWKEVGITRLSIGVQSLNNQVLSSLNRHQKAADVYALLQEAAPHFEVLSVDLILGLPGISSQEWQDLIRQVVQWPIKHLSVYFLTVHEDTPLYYGIARKKITLPTDDAMIATYQWTIEILNEHGFMQYEVSNFAKPGYESRHNSMYWQRLPYKGFGLGACSFDGKSRFQNEKNLLNYCKVIEHAHHLQDLVPLSCMVETLTEKQVWVEKLMLGVRQKRGIPWQMVQEALPEPEYEKFRQKVKEFESLGYMQRSEHFFWLTPAGRAIENEIVVALMQ